jgi:uncharacterized protein YodC (DUF2158 family)
MDFKTGDVVKLESGGPKMTVRFADKDSFTKELIVACVWFEGTKKSEGSFPPETLELAS